MPTCFVYGCPGSSSTSSREKMRRALGLSEDDCGEVPAVKPSAIQLLFDLCNDNEAPLLDPNLKFFSFPNEKFFCDQWLVKSGRESRDFTKSSSMCSTHFSKTQYDLKKLNKIGFKTNGVRVLLKTAVPDLYLPKMKKPSNAAEQRRDRALLKRKRDVHDEPTDPNITQFQSHSENAEGADQEIEGNADILDYSQTTAACSSSSREYVSGKAVDFNQNSDSTVNSCRIVEALSKSLTTSERKKKTHAENVPFVSLPESCYLYAEQDTFPVQCTLLQGLNDMVQNLHLEVKRLSQNNNYLKKENLEMKKKLSAADQAVQCLEFEKLALIKKLEKDGGCLNEKKREQIVRDALTSFFTKPQLDRMLLKKKSHWSEQDFTNSVVLLCISARAFNHIRLKLQFPMPSSTSIMRYLSNLHCVPGLLTPVLRMMEAMSYQLSELERLVTVTFDEVKISRNFCYYSRQDRVLGQMPYAHVFYVRSLFGDWGNEIFYDFDVKNTPELMNMIVTKLHEANFTVIAWSSDLGASNQGLHTALGVSIENQIVDHPVTNKAQYILTDAPHDMKNARNRLFDLGAVLNPEAPPEQHKVASKAPLMELVDLGSQYAEWNRHKLTHRHLAVQGMERQKVGTSAETLAGAVAESLRNAGERGFIECPDWLPTSEYVRVMNNFFDQFNVQEDLRGKEGLYDDPENIPCSKLPFGAKFDEQKALLLEVVEFVSQMKFKTKSGGVRKSLLPFQKGIIINCRALIQLYEDLKKRFPDEEILILTYRLNQDCLEILFSVLRALNGTFRCMTAADFPYRITRHSVLRHPHEALQANNPKRNVQIESSLQSLSSKGFEKVQLNLSEISPLAEREDEGTEELQDDQQSELEFSDDSDIEDEEGDEEGDEEVEEEEDCQEGIALHGELPDDHPANGLYPDGIRGISGIISFRLKVSHPELSQKGHLMSLPLYIEPYSKRGRAVPSNEFFENCLQMDKVFVKIHGDGLCKKSGVIKRFLQATHSVPLDLKVRKAFGMLRLRVRIRCINKIKNKNKNEVLKVNQRAPTDKDSRVYQVNNYWRA